MTPLNKVCDAADWFDPDFLRIVWDELQEIPRFHRKQWEFAVIFRTLRALKLLHPRSRGLSLGSGRERLLFSLLRHVQQLVATDLYDPHTPWDTARGRDPESFVKSEPPFPAPLEKLQVRRMDMRQIEFPDQSFDFCYSACALEHIGEWQDFLQHLQEVHRVLKPGGFYVFTTEFHYAGPTIPNDHNFLFGLEYLAQLVEESPLIPTESIAAEIFPHQANDPLPNNLNHLLTPLRAHLTYRLLEEFPHLQLLQGKQPFTSVLLTLQRPAERSPGEQPTLKARGIPQSLHFLQQGIARYQDWLERSFLTPDPCAALPGGRPGRFLSHQEWTHNEPVENEVTVFHTDYLWLGQGRRTVQLDFTWRDPSPESEMELRIHSFPALDPRAVETVYSGKIRFQGEGQTTLSVNIAFQEDYLYAVLAHRKSGQFRLENLALNIHPVQGKQ